MVTLCIPNNALCLKYMLSDNNISATIYLVVFACYILFHFYFFNLTMFFFFTFHIAELEGGRTGDYCGPRSVERGLRQGKGRTKMH